VHLWAARTPACRNRGPLERCLHARARLYRNFLYAENAPAGSIAWRRPGGARQLPLGSRCREATLTLAASGHEPSEPFASCAPAEQGAARGLSPRPSKRAGRRLSSSAGSADDSWPAILVHGLGTRHVHLRSAGSAWRRAARTRRAPILLEWAGAVSDGMLPNRFPDRGEAPEFNAVDAARVVRGRRRTIFCRPAPLTPARARLALRRGPARSSRAIAAARAYGIRVRRRLACSPRASPACSSPGWTPSSATGWCTPRIGKPSRCRRCG
jgi:hypothetical protein